MAKQDWVARQKEYLTAFNRSGISPKEWCESQKINYASARRYIKKPTDESAQTAQKTTKRKSKTAQIEKCADDLVSDRELTQRQKQFIVEYQIDGNATQAAIRAGYSAKTAQEQGARLLSNVMVAQEIAQQQKASISRSLISADEVLCQMWKLATFDANQISQYRRGSCRYCWGFGYQYQWRDMVEFEEKRLEATERKRREPVDVGGYGYDHTKEPNPRCPRCNGDGIGQAFFADTRRLEPSAALAYSGVRVGKNGVELTSISRERMYEAVIKRLGLADSEFAQQLQQIEIERRRLEVEKLRKDLASEPEDDEPQPVAISINVVDARVRSDDGDSTEA